MAEECLRGRLGRCLYHDVVGASRLVAADSYIRPGFMVSGETLHDVVGDALRVEILDMFPVRNGTLPT